MKNRSKIILSLGAMVALSAGVAATSTFAWFTSQRTATVAISNIKVDSPNGGLTVTPGTLDNGGIDINATTHAVTGTAGSYQYDVSGDGTKLSDGSNNMWGPSWTSEQGVIAQSIAVATNTSSKLYYREFTLTFKNDAAVSSGGESFNVYLTSGCTITAHTPGDTVGAQAAKAMRAGFYTSDGKTLLAYWAKEAASTPTAGETATRPYAYTYMVKKTAAEIADTTNTAAAYGQKEYKFMDASAVSTKAGDGLIGGKATLGTDFAAADTATAAQKAKQLLTTADGTTAVPLTPNAEKVVLVRLWIEGCSEFCTNDAKKGVVDFSFNFAGVIA
jgi:hypothetical protein